MRQTSPSSSSDRSSRLWRCCGAWRCGGGGGAAGPPGPRPGGAAMAPRGCARASAADSSAGDGPAGRGGGRRAVCQLPDGARVSREEAARGAGGPTCCVTNATPCTPLATRGAVRNHPLPNPGAKLSLPSAAEREVQSTSQGCMSSLKERRSPGCAYTERDSDARCFTALAEAARSTTALPAQALACGATTLVHFGRCTRQATDLPVDGSWACV
jgi:hypothetical protein